MFLVFYTNARFEMIRINVCLLLLLIYEFFGFHLCCNEALCISVISKCLLLKSCMCLVNNYTCHKACFDCLGSYTVQCCTCLEFCPKHDQVVNELSSQSHVEDFSQSIPELFKALTEHPDDLDRWTVITFPVRFGRKNEAEIFNCTVVFLNQCVSLTKCKRNCLTMGASSYRWFYNGCCECLGEHCIYHGIEMSRCRNCPDEENEDFEYEYYDYYDENIE